MSKRSRNRKGFASIYGRIKTIEKYQAKLIKSGLSGNYNFLHYSGMEKMSKALKKRGFVFEVKEEFCIYELALGVSKKKYLFKVTVVG